MAVQTPLTDHQRSYKDLKSLVESGHGIAVHEYRREDGTLMRRYVVAYDAEHNPIRRSELKRALDSGDNGLEAPKIKKINALAQSIIDSHRKAHDSTPEQQRQAAFYKRDGIHYVKSDEVEREETHEHKNQSLKTPERASYNYAFSGVTGGITGDQKEILDFGPTLVGKAPDADISAELNALNDKNFVQIFRSIRAKPENSGKTPAEVYTIALQKYTSDTVRAFQVSLHPDTALEVAKSLQKAAHKIAVPATAEEDLSETWLDDNATDFGMPTKAEAVFKAIQEVGAKEVGVDPDKHTQTTADHAYQALLSKVNQYWVETHRDTTIHEAAFVDLPVGGAAPPHGVPPRPLDEPHGTTLVNAKDVLPLIDTNEELRMLEVELRDLTELKARYNSAVDKYFDSISLIPFRTDGVARDEANREWCAVAREVAGRWTVPGYEETETDLFAYTDPVGRFISSKIPELEEKIALQKEKANFYRSPNGFIQDLGRLKQERTAKAEELTHAWRGPLGSKSTIQNQIDALDAQIESKEKLLVQLGEEWKTPKGKVELLTVYLHHGVGSAPQPKDFTSLYRKVFVEASYSAQLTPGEIGALQTWKLPENIDISDHDQVLSHLMTHLSNHVEAQNLDLKRTKIAAVDITSPIDTTWLAEKQAIVFFKGAHEFLTALDSRPDDLDQPATEEMLFALRLAHEDLEESIKTGSPEAWHTAMLRSLKAKEFEAIRPELKRTAENPDGLNTTLDAIGRAAHTFTATHYKNIHDYLVGRKLGAELGVEEIHALLDLLPTADTLEGHQKLEFLQQQAWQHYTHLRIEEETLGQNLDGWTPTEDHLRGAMAWLTDPTQAGPNDDVKKALLLVKPDSASGVGQVQAKLEQAIRIAKLEASVEDPSGYDYTAEDVLAVHAYLGGNGPELAGNQIKAFKKMQADGPLPPAFEDRPAHYKNKILTSIPIATTNKYSGRVVNWEHVWNHAVTELTGFDPSTIDTSSISKATYNSAKTKLTTTPLATLSPAEKYVIYKQHKFITENKESDTKQIKGFFLLVLLERHTPSA